MEDTLHRIVYNATTAGTAGAVVDHQSANGAIIAAIVGVVAPLLRDLLVKGLIKLFKSKK